MKKNLLSVLLMLFVVLQVSAQTGNAGFTIKGQVIDSLRNESVPYATLRIAPAQNPGKPVKLLACDTNGKFTATLKAAGKYVATIQSVGMAPATRTFTLKEGQKELNLGKIYMAEVSEHLKEVTVTAQKPLVKAEIDKITYNLEEDPEALTNNALEMLRKVPMITVDGEDKIQLKGSDNFKVYVNGKPSNLMTNNPSEVLKSMPANTIKNIEVITDPGAKYDAEGVGGIINIITKSALQGYTGTVSASATDKGGVGGGAYVSLKAGKFGLTGNYNYNYDRQPYTNSESYREDLNRDDMKYLYQDGRSKSTYNMQYGYVEGSYEIDTLNLISVSGNLFSGKPKSKSERHEWMKNVEMADVYEFKRYTRSENTFGGGEFNMDYQHSTSLKDELLTVSYKFNYSPDNSMYTTELDELQSSPLYTPRGNEWKKNTASTKEHTGQVDYTRPLPKGQNVEAGLKYILRQSQSETEAKMNDIPYTEPNSNFKHTQHIYSAYASYSLKWKKFGFKAGVRAEGTHLDVKSDNSFDKDFFNLVPSANLSYQLGASQTLRLTYNMRIQRPGIWYLNPYVDQADPLNVSSGNPDLDAEKNHNVSLNYSMFTQKFNLNASVNYSFVNNGIEQYIYREVTPEGEETNVLHRTYGNIAKNHQVRFYLYGSWNPVSQFRIYMNGGADYRDLSSQNYGSNSGWTGRVFAGAQYSLPLDFRINLNGGYFSKRISLQGEYSSMFFTGITLNKDFLKKKLTVSVSARDPFWKHKEMTSVTRDANFYQESVNHWIGRSFYFRISYRFGEMKGGIKKVRRGISNDDVKSGGNEGGGAAGEGQQ